MIIGIAELRKKIQIEAGDRFTEAETAEIASSLAIHIDLFQGSKAFDAELLIMSRLGVILGRLASPAFSPMDLQAASRLDPASNKPIPPPPLQKKAAATAASANDESDSEPESEPEPEPKIHAFDLHSELIDKEHWDKVQAAAAKFDPINNPNFCRQTCQVAGDPLAPCKTPVRADDLKVTSSVCGRIRAWGVYWLCKLAQVGIAPPDCLGNDQWPDVLEQLSEDPTLPEKLIKAFSIGPKEIQGHQYSAEEMADSWQSNMLIVSMLEKDCRRTTPTVIGVVDDRGVLQAAAEYSVMYFETPPYIAVHDLATAPWNIVGDDGRAAGAGSAIVEALVIESRATACGGRLELTPLNKMARHFYEHMHFEAGGAELKPEGAAKVLQDRLTRQSGKK